MGGELSYMLLNAPSSQRVASCTMLLEEYRGVGLKALLFLILFRVVPPPSPEV